MATSKLSGHDIEYDFKLKEWVFSDTKEIAENRACKHCGEFSTEEGHDNCLGTLIGIKNACCGHGVEGDAYIQFLDGEDIRGRDAVIILNVLKKYKAE